MVPGKMVPRKMVPRKMVPGKMVPGKNGPRKIGPRKNLLKKLFSVKRMLGNLNDFFIFINWFHYVPNCRTLKESRKICCRVLGFHRLITSEHFTHTPWHSTLTPRFLVSDFSFVSEFCVCCRVLGFHRLITSEHFTHTPWCSTPTRRLFVSEFPGDHFSRGPFFLGTIFPRTIFPGDHFSGDYFSRDHFPGIHQWCYYSWCQYKNSGGGQNLKRPNVERPIFRKFETSNIEITKFSNLFLIFTSIWIVRTLKIYDYLPNWKFLEF